MTEIQRILSVNIKQLRSQQQLSQNALSELCNTSTNYIGLIETGKKFPSAKMLETIAKALKVKSYELFTLNINISNSKILKSYKEEILKKMDAVIEESFIKYS